MIRKLENKSTQSMQCDLLADKRICKPQSTRPEGKKKPYTGNLLSLEVVIQQPLVPRKRFQVAKPCHPCSQSACCLAASVPSAQMRCSSHSQTPQRSKLPIVFIIALLVLEKAVKPLFPLKIFLLE